MGNLSCSVSGLGAGDASRKSLRGSMRSCQRRRAIQSCRHYADTNRLIGVLGDGHKAKATRQERGQINSNFSTDEFSDDTNVLSTAALEELLDSSADGHSEEQNIGLSASLTNNCVSSVTDDGETDDSATESSDYYSVDYLEQLVTSLTDEVENDDVLVMCDEDKALMLLKTTTTICGEEWINWTALCPCCRRDASDDSIDLQELIKLEPIRVVAAEMYERQIFGAGGKVGKCLGCFHMGVVVTLEHPCRKSTETRYLIHKLRDFDDDTEGILTVARMSAVNVGKVWHLVPDTKKTVQRSTFLDFKNACGNEYRLFGNNCVHSVKRMMELP